jgi:hypothetical protein
MIKVWTDGAEAGLLVRHGERGTAFTYLPRAPQERAVSVTMPVRVASWDWSFGLAPFFDMNLERLKRLTAGSRKQVEDSLPIVEFVDFVRVEDPRLLSVLGTMATTGAKAEAARKLGLPDLVGRAGDFSGGAAEVDAPR